MDSMQVAKMANRFALLFQFSIICAVVYLKLRADTSYFLTPDSYHYLHAAQSLLDGKGYHIIFEGGDTFCAIWPMGYSSSIAVIAWVTGFSVEISSKIINLLALAGCFGVIYSRFRERAWFISLAFFASSLVQVYANTWSETLFLFFVVGFAVQNVEAIPTKAGELFWTIGAFLSRYVAVFLAFVLLIQRKFSATLYYLLFVAGYLLFNYSQTKTFTGGHGFWPKEPFGLRLWRGLRGLGEELLFFAMRDWDLKNAVVNDATKWLIYSIAVAQFLMIGLIMREFWKWVKENELDVYSMTKKVTKSLFFRVGMGYLLFTIAIYLTDASIESLYFRRLAPASLLLTLGLLAWVSSQKSLFEHTKWYFVIFFALSIIHALPK
jgi:hypothetical protein